MSWSWDSTERDVAAAVVVGLYLTIACGTDAVGIDACRQIESARCEAAIHCGKDLGVTDAESCRRFYETQCLHGFAADDAPGAPEVNACVAAIQRAGSCAERKGEEATCDGLESELREPATACQVITHPEKASSCAFLVPSPDSDEEEEEEEAAAGAGGSGGEASGAGKGGVPADPGI